MYDVPCRYDRLALASARATFVCRQPGVPSDWFRTVLRSAVGCPRGHATMLEVGGSAVGRPHPFFCAVGCVFGRADQSCTTLVYYPGTRRIIPGPVTTRSGTGSILPARRFGPGYPTKGSRCFTCPRCDVSRLFARVLGPGTRSQWAPDGSTTLVQTPGYAQV